MTITSEDKASLGKTLDDLKLTGPEVEKFEKCFKDAEFMKLFEEYAKEMSDPANKAETDAYLRQMEMQGQIETVYGKGTVVIVPEPEFVIKTAVQGDGKKVFVNICSSDKVDKPSMTAATKPDGTKGQQWSIPLSLGQQRAGEDGKGRECWVYDFAVHPDAIRMAHSNKGFERIVVDSALENIERMAKTPVAREYKRLTMKFKRTPGQDKPGVQAKRGAQSQTSGGHLKPDADKAGVPGVEPSAPPKKSAPSKFGFPAVKPKAPAAGRAAPKKRPQDPGYVHPGGEVTPVYELVQSGQIDIQDAWADKGLDRATSCPKALIVRVNLPGTSSVAGVDLEVSARSVSVEVAGKYKLQLDLQYTVDDAKGKAKFDKARCQLSVTLPVIPPSAPARRPSAATADICEDPVTELTGSSMIVELPSTPAAPPVDDASPSEAPATPADVGASNDDALVATAIDTVDHVPAGTAVHSSTSPGGADVHDAGQPLDMGHVLGDVLAAPAGEAAMDDGERDADADAAGAANESAVALCVGGAAGSAGEVIDLKLLARQWKEMNQARDAEDCVTGVPSGEESGEPAEAGGGTVPADGETVRAHAIAAAPPSAAVHRIALPAALDTRMAEELD